MDLVNRGRNVAEILISNRSLRNGYIYFVAHSLGGLVLKQAFRILDGRKNAGSEVRNTDAGDFLNRVTKVAFLATPHAGSDVASTAKRLKKIVAPTEVVGALVRNDSHLSELNTWYRGWASSRFNHLVLIEQLPVRFIPVLWYAMIVKPDSADPGFTDVEPIPVTRTHISICKIDKKSEDVYIFIRDFLADDRDYATQSLSPEAVRAQASKIASKTSRRLSAMRIKIEDISLETNVSVGRIFEDMARAPEHDSDDVARFEKLMRSQSPSDEAQAEPPLLSERQTENKKRDESQLGILNFHNKKMAQLATQGIALAEVGLDRKIPVMIDRGLRQLGSALQSMSQDYDQMPHFQSLLVDLETRRKQLIERNTSN